MYIRSSNSYYNYCVATYAHTGGLATKQNQLRDFEIFKISRDISRFQDFTFQDCNKISSLIISPPTHGHGCL